MMSILDLFTLQGKTALITGASSGLGAYFAKILAESGATVIVTARRQDKLEKLVSEIEVAGGKAFAVAMDVTSTSSVNQAFADIESITNRLDILVNNAGVVSTPQKFLTQPEDEWDFVMETNLKGAWRIAQRAAQMMAQQKSGSIINTCSIYSLATGVLKTDYNVSKAAVLQMTKNMALELCRSNIRVNAICPGYFKTELNEDSFNSEKGQAYISRLVPQRLGEYQELAGTLLLLASNAGSYINGTAIVVDGGSILSPV